MGELAYIFFLLLILLALVYVIYIFSYSILFGAPYAVTRYKKVEELLDLLEIKKGDLFVDLGSGDGRIVIAAAKRGAIAYGYELNPILVFISRRKIKSLNLSEKAIIYQRSYWQVDLGKYQKLSIFGIPHIMSSMEKKLKRELNSGALVASNHFKFKNWKISKKLNNLYLYKR